MTTTIVLEHHRALGDTVLMTALVRDIRLQYGDQYKVAISTNWSPVWYNNPYITPRAIGDKINVRLSWQDAVKCHSMAMIQKQSVRRHILAWYHYNFTRQTGIPVHVTRPSGELFLSKDELQPLLLGRYWVVVAGGKEDLTNKYWDWNRFQELSDRMRHYGLHVVQAGATHHDHHHPLLNGAHSMVGKTDNPRDFFNLIAHADGVVCGVTAAAHIAAVYDRPCVVLGGGREEPWFETYTDVYGAFGESADKVIMPHRYLHTMGLLDCCRDVACWRKRTVPLGPQDTKQTVCVKPVYAGSQPLAACMDMIQVNHVIEAVMGYYESDALPPIGAPRNTYPIREITTETQPAPSWAQEPLQPGRPPLAPEKPAKPGQRLPPGAKTRHVPASKPECKFNVLDNPVIGGKFTIFLLCYGDYPQLAKRCLSKISATLPRDRYDLRIGTNQVSQSTLEVIREFAPDKLYVHPSNDKKYPVMRQMFHDPTAPIQTRYLIWFDDDAWPCDDDWAIRLGESIVSAHQAGYRLYGDKRFHDLIHSAVRSHRPEQWFRDADWFRSISFRSQRGAQAPNGSLIDFVVGWFWALETNLVRLANIPDPRLLHNGGDITIGEQVHQQGFKIQPFNKDKRYVTCPTKEAGGRRGFSEEFPWSLARAVA